MTENKPSPFTHPSPFTLHPSQYDGDQLLEQFFAACRKEQLPDDGFTRRVMMRLPARQRRLSQLWTLVCIAVGLALFTLIGGWQQVAEGLINVLSSSFTPMQLLNLMVCGAVLTTIAAAELIRHEHLHVI